MKRGRPRKEVPTPVATSPDSKHSEHDTSGEDDQPETARHKRHYPEDDEWSLGSDPPDFGSNNGFPPLIASPSPLHNTAPIASPESFSVDVSEVDSINLRPASPITTIGDHAPISPDRQLSPPNARNIEASPSNSVQLQLPSPDESDFSVLDVNIDPNASINTSSDAAGTSSKRPKLPAKPDNNEGSDDPQSINKESQWFLVVVKLKDAQPYVVSFYDSVPAEENTKVARRRTQRLLELYLPNATISVNRLFKRMAGPLQSNGHDCGVYVFATALHLIVDENLPSEYHSTIWRKLMAAALSEGGSWDRALMLPTPPNDPAKPPACDDGSATAYGNWEAQMKKWQDDKRTRMIQKTEQFTQPNEK
ncbi:hypothetical protein K4K54_005307 [Colletotrichum sp. SAR 10_86]|nr:hypothetical protein KHU50_005628 [Colletotrichum sp. SAR 10_65]KAI8224424.1 hypothetical protein K4K54_005307 [Colletotrichum sp. SAR 10_86]